jgi:hypothetical protein
MLRLINSKDWRHPCWTSRVAIRIAECRRPQNWNELTIPGSKADIDFFTAARMASDAGDD